MNYTDKSKEEIIRELLLLQKSYEELKVQFEEDLSFLKLSDDRFRKSEELFRKVFTISPDSININRLSDGIYVSVNPGFTRMLGYSEEEAVGKSSLELNIWTDPERRITLTLGLQENGWVDNFEAVFRKKDGSEIFGLMSASLIELEGVPHILNVTKDITSRKLIEKTLAEEQYVVGALMDNIPDHVYFKDLSSRFIRINKSHAARFGIGDPSEAVGKTDFDYFSAEHAQQAFDDEQEIIRTGRTLSKEEKETHSDRPYTWVSTVKMPLLDKDGTIIGTFGISRDITVQKKDQEQLFLLANALKSINDCVSITDMYDKVLFLNKAFIDTYGFTEDDLKEENISQIRSLNNPPEISAKILPETLKGGWHGELFNRKKDGSEFMVSLSTAVVKDSGGEPVALIGVANDITERKRLEMENQVLYEITQGITTTSHLDELLKLIHHSISKVVYAENFFVALYNQKTALFNFPYFVDQFDTTPEPTSMIKSCSAYVFRNGKSFLFATELFKQLEQQNEVELVGSASPSWIGIPVKTPSKVIGVLVLQHYEKENVYTENDVRFLESIGGQIAFAIERKQAESALRESERDLYESQKIAELGSYNLDFRTKTWTSTIILDSLFGIDEKFERTISGWAEIIHPDWRELMTTYLQKNVIGNREVFDKEYKIIRRTDNTERWVHGRGELLYGQNGELVSMIGNIVDITRKKLAEEEIKLKNEQLMAINAEKDKFFSILAHDLRGPLSSFVAATQIITEDIQIMSIEEIKDITLSMKTTAAGIYSLLENLLEWSRLRRGGMDFVPVKIDLKKKTEECTNVLSESARKKDIKIDIAISDNVNVFSDNHMLDTVIRNLVSNAIKFTPLGGKVTLASESVANDLIEVSVSDSGIGMTPQLINKLFLLNEKTSRQGTEGEQSTGLGLLLCKEFIEKNGGKIRVDSEEGKGSTFAFTIKKYT